MKVSLPSSAPEHFTVRLFIETLPFCDNDLDVETVHPLFPVCACIKAVMPFAFVGTVPLPDTVKVLLSDAPQKADPDPGFSATPFTVRFHVAVAEEPMPGKANLFPLHVKFHENVDCALASGMVDRMIPRTETNPIIALFMRFN